MTLMEDPSHPGEVLAELCLEPLGMSAIDSQLRMSAECAVPSAMAGD